MKTVKLRSLLLGTYITFITSISPLAICQDASEVDTDPKLNTEYINDVEVVSCVSVKNLFMRDYSFAIPPVVTTQVVTASQITGTTSSTTTTTTTAATTLMTTTAEIQTTTVATESFELDEEVEDEAVATEVVEEIVTECVTEATTEITTEVTTEAATEPVVEESTLPITDQEFILIANVISHEAGCSWIGEYERACIVAAIMNRVNDSRWPGTIDEVVHQPYQMFNVPYYRVDYSGIGTEVIDNAIYAYFNGTYDCGSINSWWGDGRNNHFYTI